jgi:hypothetical protein
MKKITLFIAMVFSLFAYNAYSYGEGCRNSYQIMHEAHDLDMAARHFSELLQRRYPPYSRR